MTRARQCEGTCRQQERSVFASREGSTWLRYLCFDAPMFRQRLLLTPKHISRPPRIILFLPPARRKFRPTSCLWRLPLVCGKKKPVVGQRAGGAGRAASRGKRGGGWVVGESERREEETDLAPGRNVWGRPSGVRGRARSSRNRTRRWGTQLCDGGWSHLVPKMSCPLLLTHTQVTRHSSTTRSKQSGSIEAYHQHFQQSRQRSRSADSIVRPLRHVFVWPVTSLNLSAQRRSKGSSACPCDHPPRSTRHG